MLIHLKHIVTVKKRMKLFFVKIHTFFFSLENLRNQFKYIFCSLLKFVVKAIEEGRTQYYFLNLNI